MSNGPIDSSSWGLGWWPTEEAPLTHLYLTEEEFDLAMGQVYGGSDNQ